MTLTRRSLLKQTAALAVASGFGPRLFAAETRPGAPAVIRIGIASPATGNPPSFAGGPLAIAHAQGSIEEEFRKDGTKVEWVFFKGQGPAVNEALTNHQLDFGFQGELPAVIGRSVGLPTRVVLAVGRRTNIYIATPPGSDIHSVADLRGRRVAVPKGTTFQLAFDRILTAHGLQERDVRIISMDSATATAALQSKDVEALVSSFDLLYAQSRGLAHVFYSTRDLPAATVHGQLVATNDFAQRYPDATRRVVRSVVKAARWSADEANRQEVFKLFARMGIPEEVWRAEYDGTSLTLRLSPLLDPFIIARYQQAMDEAARFGLIRRKFDVASWIDRSFLDAVLAEQKLNNFWPQYDAAGKPIASS